MTQDQDQMNRSLLNAVKDGDIEICRRLLAAGASPRAKDVLGRTPLFFVAAEYGHTGIVKLLLEAGADPNEATKFMGTPLHPAAMHNRVEVVILLLDHGADVNATDGEGQTPLHLTRNADLLALLLERGANPNTVDCCGETPLHKAATSNWADVASLLLERGVDPNAVDRDGYTPLHDTALYGSVAVARALLGRGADPCLADGEGDTALVHAIKSGRELVKVKAMVDLLVDAGASPADVVSGRSFWQRVPRANPENKRYLRARLTERRIGDAMDGPIVDHAPSRGSSGPGPL